MSQTVVLPPHDTDAESGVLGAMLRDNGVIADVVLLVSAASFYHHRHQQIFAAILGVHEPGAKPVDLRLLSHELKRRGQLAELGDRAYLRDLWEKTPTAANVTYYAQIVRDKALVRALIRAAQQVLQEAYQQTQPAEELLGQAEQSILAVSQLGAEGQAFPIRARIGEVMRLLDERARRDRKLSGLSSGFLDLDDLTAGWQPSTLIVLAARPSVGKTALCLALLRHVVQTEKQHAFFASLEQSGAELGERLLSMLSGVSSHAMRRGVLTSAEMNRLIEAAEALHRLPLYVDDTPRQNMVRIAANARRLHKRHGLALVAVDYLQLIEPENRKASRHEQVGTVALRLKELARELRLPVLALAQLNREVEGRPDPRPLLKDLRESGEIEQHADLVVMMHQPRDADKDKTPLPQMELLLRKHRNGPTGELKLAYHKECFRFDNYAIPEHPFREARYDDG